MTEREMADALARSAAIEVLARAEWRLVSDDIPDRDAAIMVVRHATALKRALEQWIVARRCRAVGVEAAS